MQLNLLESTVITDIVFEEEFAALRVYKKKSKSKVTLFSIVLSFFILFLFVITRYLFDDRIYDRAELEKIFEEVSIIGSTPDFD